MTAAQKATWIGSISILLWGTLALMTRLTDGEIPPFQLMAMTFFIAFLLMAVNWWRQGDSGLRYLRQPRLAWLLGVGGYFGYHFCYFRAMQLAPAVEVSLLAYLWPLLIVLLSALLPGERLRWAHCVGALLALAGCWLLLAGTGAPSTEISADMDIGTGVETGGQTGGETGAETNPDYIFGYALALGCAVIWSGYSVASRTTKSVPTAAVGWFCLVTAVLAAVCHVLWESFVWPSQWQHWLGIIGLGLGPVGIAFFTWDYGVKHGHIQLLGVLAYAAPLISVVLLLLAGEGQWSVGLLLACIAIVGGSLLAGMAKRSSAAV
ncbi:EamA family transporter [Bacterioplanes sanyensis]|uniref:EamA family transporter n=1 Tax=Bacterioplanes sanyensis TaxID=1249553 RepID=A0A222FRM5_9GAMM|nr:EamA family transporter [Bacterioplanes sanyensis]ASP40863.1 EamA family transporter [Bacterioplanes sanyensis]